MKKKYKNYKNWDEDVAIHRYRRFKPTNYEDCDIFWKNKPFHLDQGGNIKLCEFHKGLKNFKERFMGYDLQFEVIINAKRDYEF